MWATKLLWGFTKMHCSQDAGSEAPSWTSGVSSSLPAGAAGATAATCPEGSYLCVSCCCSDCTCCFNRSLCCSSSAICCARSSYFCSATSWRAACTSFCAHACARFTCAWRSSSGSSIILWKISVGTVNPGCGRDLLWTGTSAWQPAWQLELPFQVSRPGSLHLHRLRACCRGLHLLRRFHLHLLTRGGARLGPKVLRHVLQCTGSSEVQGQSWDRTRVRSKDNWRRRSAHHALHLLQRRNSFTGPWLPRNNSWRWTTVQELRL